MKFLGRHATRPPVVIDTGASQPVIPLTLITPGTLEVGEEGGDDEEEDQAAVNEIEPDSPNSSTQSFGEAQSTSRKRKRASRSVL